MAKFQWNDFLHTGEESDDNLDTDGFILSQKKDRLDRENIEASILFVTFNLGIAFGIFAMFANKHWFVQSPLLTVLGIITSFVFLLIGCLLGGIGWVLTGNSSLCKWAWNQLPYCGQPYLSGFGGFGTFLIIAFICQELHLCKKVSLATANKIRFFLWIMLFGVWGIYLVVLLLLLFFNRG